MFQKFLTITLKSDTIFPTLCPLSKNDKPLYFISWGITITNQKEKKKSIKVFENKMSYVGKIQVHEFV